MASKRIGRNALTHTIFHDVSVVTNNMTQPTVRLRFVLNSVWNKNYKPFSNKAVSSFFLTLMKISSQELCWFQSTSEYQKVRILIHHKICAFLLFHTRVVVFPELRSSLSSTCIARFEISIIATYSICLLSRLLVVQDELLFIVLCSDLLLRST